ncbi:MAG: hypothetical protein H0X50_07695 [Nitrosopumilus sp.]|nr:hypothetical protein [Nitrosopumilus sp.]
MKITIKSIMVFVVLSGLFMIAPALMSGNAFAQSYEYGDSSSSSDNDNGDSSSSSDNDNGDSSTTPSDNDNGDSSTTPSDSFVEITSHDDGETVPVGELTIEGTSSDAGDSNCHIYADWNDVYPYQSVEATGGDGSEDYSSWEFTYTDDYETITEGDTNELTVKYYCGSNSDASNSVYDTVNLIGEE